MSKYLIPIGVLWVVLSLFIGMVSFMQQESGDIVVVPAQKDSTYVDQSASYSEGGNKNQSDGATAASVNVPATVTTVKVVK